MIVVGVDPGLRFCGIAVLHRKDQTAPWTALSVRTVTTSPRMPLHERLRRIWDALDAPRGNGAEPVVVAVETQSGAAEGKRRKGETNASARLVEQVVGLVRALSFLEGASFVEVTPQEAKRVIGGMAGTATKAAVSRAVRAIVRNCPEGIDEHASDAVAIAVAGARKASALSVFREKRATGKRRR